jgi:hypothetical protein
MTFEGTSYSDCRDRSIAVSLPELRRICCSCFPSPLFASCLTGQIICQPFHPQFVARLEDIVRGQPGPRSWPRQDSRRRLAAAEPDLIRLPGLMRSMGKAPILQSAPLIGHGDQASHRVTSRNTTDCSIIDDQNATMTAGILSRLQIDKEPLLVRNYPH